MTTGPISAAALRRGHDPARVPGDLLQRLLSAPACDVPGAIVDEAQARGRCAAALYVVDLEGAVLRLLSGSPWWPHEIALVRGAVGPEMPVYARAAVQDAVRAVVAGAVVQPVAHEHAAIAFLAWERPPLETVEALAAAAAAALQAADRRTDVIARARRARRTSASAEVQENLLPPRLATLARGGEIAGAIIPAYDFGGDWFDYAENPSGVWLAVADAAGAGVPAAAPSLLSLGAFRAARRAGGTLEDAARHIDATVKELNDPGKFVTAILAQWLPGSAEFRWLRFGHPPAIRVSADGSADTFGEDRGELPLGLLDPATPLAPQALELAPGDRILLTSDGVWERQLAGGPRLEIAGIRAALGSVPGRDAASTVSGVTRFVRRASDAPLGDDATVVCLALPTRRR